MVSNDRELFGDEQYESGNIPILKLKPKTIFLSNFWAKKSDLWKKVVFCLMVGGFSLPTPLVVRPLKKIVRLS